MSNKAVSKSNTSCQVYVTFESDPHQIRLGEDVVVPLPCDADSQYLEYELRRALQDLKRIAPFEQQLTRLPPTTPYPLVYRLKVRERDETQLLPLTIHSHHGTFYKLQIDKHDRVMDLKFLLSPLVNNGRNAESIQLNFNTMRRLRDDEVVYNTGCVDNSAVVLMFWFEFVTPLKSGESPVYQSVAKLVDSNALYPDVGTAIRRICRRFIDHGDSRGTLGCRAYIDAKDFSRRGAYEYTDYARLNARIDLISCALKHELGLTKGGMLGLCSKNRREWLLHDYACAVSGIVSVPLYPTLSADALAYISDHAELECIVTDTQTLPDIVALLKECRSLKSIVVMDDEAPDKTFLQSEKGRGMVEEHKSVIRVLSELEKVVKRKLENGVYAVQDEQIDADRDIYTIMYTSGTTGNPKGVCLSHHNMMSQMNAYLDIRQSKDDEGDKEIVHLSYLPLAHCMERALNMVMLIRGFKIGFFSGSIERLVEDMNVIKPVTFMGVPRVFQRIQDSVLNGMNSQSALIRWLFRYAYAKKVYAIENRCEPGWLDKYVFTRMFWSKINGAFGGNIAFIGSGSAPLSVELAQFLRVTLCDITAEGYGLTETTTGGTGTHPFDLQYGHVGQPRINIQMKLVDVPDMGYLSSDKPNARGEIWLRGPTIFKGYYKQPQKTKEVLFDDGWFATGDIGEWRAEGRLQIIDRKKNIFKLAQGEYIRPEYIQNVYKMSRYIANIFVYGNSLENYLVAIIVPDFEALQQVGFGRKDVDQNNVELVERIKQDMKEQEESAKLNGFEKVKKFKLITEEFTTENGLLTISMKLKRNVARKRFEKELKALYKTQSKL